MNTSAHSIEINVQNFPSEVVEKSQQIPVLLEFYAEAAQESVAASGLLSRLVAEFQGKFILARVNIQENPQLVQQLGVRQLPTIKLISQGQIALEQAGELNEPQLRNTLEQLTRSPMERIREEIDQLLAQGDRPQAISMLQAVIAEEPKNYGLHAELSDLLIQENQLDEARKILTALPADSEGINKPRNRLAFIDEAETIATASELEAKIAAIDDIVDDIVDETGQGASPARLEARLAPRLELEYQLAIRLIVDGRIEPALETLLNMLKQDRLWEDEKARKTMLKVFDMLGRGAELATAYRRKMFSFLH